MKSRGEGTAVTVTVHVQLSTLHTKHVAQLQPRSAAERGTVIQEDIHVTGVSAAKHSAGSLCGVGRLRAHASLFEELAVCAALRFPTAAAMQCRTASWLRWGWREWSARQVCISFEKALPFHSTVLSRPTEVHARGASCAQQGTRRTMRLGPETLSAWPAHGLLVRAVLRERPRSAPQSFYSIGRKSSEAFLERCPEKEQSWCPSSVDLSEGTFSACTDDHRLVATPATVRRAFTFGVTELPARRPAMGSQEPR